MSPDDVNVYLNFVLRAVYGQLGAADQLMTMFGDRIRRVADRLVVTRPVASTPLYRGMLIEPGRDVRVEPQFPFVSWSEDRDVACWFGSPASFISEPFREFYPEARGVVLQIAADRPRRVLFHYTWGEHLATLAMIHPEIGAEGARQIAWSLRTQREVITAPLDGELPPATPINDVPHPPIHELDRRLAPPWCHDDLPVRRGAAGV